MAKQQCTTRDDKANALIAAGRIQLFPGTGTAIAYGSNGERYRITRESCECGDWEYRHEQVGDCAHRIGARLLCEGYRQHRARQAPLSPILMAALVAYHTEQEAAQAVPVPAKLDPDANDLFVEHQMPTTQKVLPFPSQKVAS